jgi:hypothetical protein
VVALGRYWRMRPLVFSLVPRSQAWCGVPDDLRGAPAQLQQCCDGHEVDRFIARVAPGASAPAVCHLDGAGGPIGPIVGGRISLHLARHRARMSSEQPSDLPRSEALPTQRTNLISFFRAQLPIDHRPKVSHLLPESKKPNKAPEPTTMAVTIRAPSSTARASHGRGSS